MGTATLVVLWTLGIVSELSCRHSDELAQRQHLRSSMGFYFPPRILEDVLANPGSLEPRRVEITVLLTDLRNSTPLAEQLGAEGMLGLLNQIFAIENRAVFRQEGSLEKPVGDQFLAYWGAPDPQPDAARRAVHAAEELIAGLDGLKRSLPVEVQKLFGYGVSIHSGSALLANIGSEQFYHYGIVGDLINATARIEALTKVYGVRALITREVLEQLVPRPVSRLIDVVVVKGKSVPVELHEVRHLENERDFERVRGPYAEALRLYVAGCFREAAERFALLAAEDGPSRLLRERCTRFLQKPPLDWRGVYAFESK
jgi:adenylate cyclase